MPATCSSGGLQRDVVSAALVVGRPASIRRQCTSCRAPAGAVWVLLLVTVACCSSVAHACSHPQDHGGVAADSCNAPKPTLFAAAAPAAGKSAASAPAAAAYDEPVSIHYEETSEADLIAAVAAAAARRRQLLSDPAAADAAEVPSQDDADDANDADTAAAAAGAGAEQRPLRRCGARELTAEERSEVSLHLEHHKAHQAVHQRARLASMSTAAALPPARTSLNIPLYFHVITGKTKNSTVDAPQELLLKQLQAMNDAYGRYSIRFDLKGITRVRSEAWAVAEINSPEETLMKAKLRKGGLGDLNIYVIRPASGTLGWSTFPWEAIKLGESFDGVVVHVGTMPGGNMKPYNKGYTMVHEVGHFLGLLHVFENGCDSPGDNVDDTPPQASAAYGCPIHRHSCPGSTNNDPVQNMMGYTDDACMIGFTRGQADRVLAMWDIYRAQGAQQKVVAEKSLSKGGSQQQQQQGPAQASKQQGPKGQQQQPGVTLLEQGALSLDQLPESVEFIPSAPPVDPAAAFAAKQAAAQAGGLPADSSTVPPTKQLQQQLQQQQQQQQRSTPAGPSKPRWPSFIPGVSLISLNAPGAMLEANAQVKQAQEEQQHQKRKQRHNKEHKGGLGWGSWLTGRPAPTPASPATVNAAAAAAAVAAYQQQWQPEMGQYASAAADPQQLAAGGVPVLQPWSTQQQQQQQQQFQYQYAQQQQVYLQHQQQQILPAGPLAPQYLFGGVGPGSDIASSQAALLAAMGGVQAYPMAAVYDGAGAGGFSVAAAADQQLPDKHAKKGSRKKPKGSRG